MLLYAFIGNVGIFSVNQKIKAGQEKIDLRKRLEASVGDPEISGISADQLANNANNAWGPGELPKSFYKDSHLEFDGSSLDIIDNYSDGATRIRGSYSAVSGPGGNGALPNGEYVADNFRIRTKPTMVRDGVGFSVDLTPGFETSRDLLRIHPDGSEFGNWSINNGTNGCIGLQCGSLSLKKFQSFANSYLSRNGNIRLTVR